MLNRLFWIKDPINKEEIKAALTVRAKAYISEGEIVRFYEEDGEWLGVPRMWGLGRYPGLVADETVFPYIEWPSPHIEYWPGQAMAVKTISDKFLDGGLNGALLDASPGSGKTLVSLCVASELMTPTLVLVHKEDLLYQWKERAKEIFTDISIGHVQESIRDYEEHHFTVAMAQTLYVRKDEIEAAFWRHFGLVIYDEAHKYGARTFEFVSKMFPARYRLGVSATFRRADGLACAYKWHIGKIEHKLKTYRVYGDYQQVPWKTDLNDRMFRRWDKKINNGSYITAIARSKKYNEWLASTVADAAKRGRKILVVTDRIDQINALKELLVDNGVSSIGIYVGETSPEGLIDATKCSVILGTFGKISEGSDIPALDTLILATPRADVEQVVGRVLRRHKDKKPVLIVDPVFQTQYMRRLAEKRVKIYKKLEFKERKDE